MNDYNYTYLGSFDAYKSLGVKSRNIDFLINWLHDIYKIAYLPCTDQSAG